MTRLVPSLSRRRAAPARAALRNSTRLFVARSLLWKIGSLLLVIASIVATFLLVKILCKMLVVNLGGMLGVFHNQLARERRGQR